MTAATQVWSRTAAAFEELHVLDSRQQALEAIVEEQRILNRAILNRIGVLIPTPEPTPTVRSQLPGH